MATIRTKDADEAAFIWSQDGFDLDRTEVEQGYRKSVIFFVFNTDKTTEEINELISDYKNGKTLVEPKRYAWRRAEVKGIIREKLFS